MAQKKIMRHASGLKAHRKSEALRKLNFAVRSKVRTLTQKVVKDIAAKNVQAAKASFKVAQSAWQRAAQKGIFSKNAASRKIGVLSARVSALSKN
ncbi:MAG: 30S ribosomal protein S20 [Elusimicrobiota bacterium]